MEGSNRDLEQLAKEMKRQYARDYYKKNRQKLLTQRKKHREENREELLTKEKAYRDANKDKVRKWNADYWKRQAAKSQMSNMEGGEINDDLETT